MDFCEVWIIEPETGHFRRTDQFANAKSANEIGLRLPDGVYTTLRTYQKTKVLRLERHFDRLEESSELLGEAFRVDRGQLRQIMRIAINQSSFPKANLRVHFSLKDKTRLAYVILEPLHTPSSKDYDRGVAVLTTPAHRTNPLAKSSEFIRTAEAMRKEMPPGIHEMVMVSTEGEYLEGLSSNIFFLSRGAIWTADLGVLHGLTRELLLTVIKSLAIPLIFAGYPVARTADADECYISSSSRGVLPVAQIDKRPIGGGYPGEVTQILRRSYDAAVSMELEEI